MMVVLSQDQMRQNQLGIPMGAPYHQNKDIISKHKVAVFSSNYQFYGDMSQRVMSSLKNDGTRYGNLLN